jgi:hypothetical protein
MILRSVREPAGHGGVRDARGVDLIGTEFIGHGLGPPRGGQETDVFRAETEVPPNANCRIFSGLRPVADSAGLQAEQISNLFGAQQLL